jgi:osomolarity two-component system sensor histidine kinase SLN1
MRSMLVPLRLAADARGLELESEFDPAIDETIRKANRGDEVKRGMGSGGEEGDDDEAIVLGDEVRICALFFNICANTRF